MNPTEIFSITQFCQQIFASEPASPAGRFWSAVTTFWGAYWLYILIGLTLWVIFELVTRHGGVHYNSSNGFSPTFNRFVGSGVYLLFDALVIFILIKIFGQMVYCNPWTYPIHAINFGLTWLLLWLTGFWDH